VRMQDLECGRGPINTIPRYAARENGDGGDVSFFDDYLNDDQQDFDDSRGIKDIEGRAFEVQVVEGS
jgi:hypothetical protein